MSKTYRAWNPDQTYLLPPSPRDWLPDGDMVYFVLDVAQTKGDDRTDLRPDAPRAWFSTVPDAWDRQDARRMALVCTTHNLLKLFRSQQVVTA